MPTCRLSRLAVLLAFLLPAFAGLSVAEGADLQALTFESGGRTRTYHLYVPPGHDKHVAVPLVLALHGGGGRGALLDDATGGAITKQAALRGWVVAFPDGVAKGWNDGRKLVSRRDRARKDVDDVAFLSAVIDRVHAAQGIDRQRVYATGISNGGFMSFRLAVDLSAKIKAIAPVTAQMTPYLAERTPATRVAVMVVNGTSDPLIPYAGGRVRVLGQDRGEVLSTDASIRWWVVKNQATPQPRVVWLPDRTRDGTRVRVSTYAAGERGAEVVLYQVIGGGHTWPGGKQYLSRLLVGRVCRDFDGTKAIFDFFARQGSD